MVFFLMLRRPPRSTRTDTLLPFTTLFRSMLLRGDGTMLESLLPGADAMAPWIAAWWDRIAQDSTGPIDHADAMDAVNPLYIPRNHLVELGRASCRASVCTYV